MSVSPAWAPPRLDPYPERRDPRDHWLDAVETAVLAAPRALAAAWRIRGAWAVVRAAGAAEAALRDLDAAGLRIAVAALRDDLHRQELRPATLAQGCALVREASRRWLGLRQHDVQVLGALAILDGRVAEMATGEGKTITAGMAAALAALAGTPTHVVTVNDYLAERDATTLGPLYAGLGLTLGVLRHGMPPDERRAAYGCDIAYASNKELAFDYLRDQLALGRAASPARLKLRQLLAAPALGAAKVVMRGLHFAIVDEADSVLIDEARTPLIIARETDAAAEQRWAREALALADTLEQGSHYRLLAADRRVLLTTAGQARLTALGEAMGGVWAGRIRREEATRQALTARLLFQRGDHYLVRDGKVEIVDESTGRVMADRSWSDGLHQIIEVKEACAVTPRKETLARLTYQRLFRRYQRLAGMTGTAAEARGEFWSVYRLRIARIPPDLPSRLHRGEPEVLPTLAAKWEQVADRAATLTAAGCPVLIGTRSVSASHAISAVLAAQGLPHAVLNAENDHEEAVTIAAAGQPGRITVATNMAGRGVDILLAPGVAARGGLHVVLTERHDSRRIDRQLEGRAGRRGQPGSTTAILSLQDPLLELLPSSAWRWLAARPGALGRLAARGWFSAAQARARRSHLRARLDLLAHEKRLRTMLAFAGEVE